MSTAYEVAQIVELATGVPASARQLDGWGAYVDSGGSLHVVADAFIASTMFANKYNGGQHVDPEAPITTHIAEQIIQNALGFVPTSDRVDAWVSTGLPTAQVFEDFALGDQFAHTVGSQMTILPMGVNQYFIVPFDPFPS